MWFLLKVLLFLYMYVWFRATLPRLRYDQLMDFGWKLLIPVALGWFVVLAAINLGRDRDWSLWVVVPIALIAIGLGYLLFNAALGSAPATGHGKGRCTDGLPRGVRRHDPPAPAVRRQAGDQRVLRGRARERRGRGSDPEVADDEKVDKPERLHGRHVLNRYEDGMEKCIGCELCAGVCPAKCIYVRGADNDPDDPTSPGERFGYVYEINYLRCIHCDLCVEACPTEAITESKLFEFSFSNRRDAIYTKDELLVGDDGKPKQLPWEDWREGEDADTSGWMRATSPSGDATFEGVVGWSGELGYGVRARARSGRDLMELVVFVLASAMVLVGAFGVVLMSNPVHAAMSLVLTLFGVAVHFVAMEAHFLAAVQVIVYAGAIVVLFLFVIMLLGVDRADDLQIEPFPIQRPLALVVGVGTIGLVAAAILRAKDSVDREVALESSGDSNIRLLARNLFQDHVFAFELTSVLLIVAVAGTVVMTRKPRHPEHAPTTEQGRRVIAAYVPTSTWYLLLAAALFGIGATGLLVRRNPLVMFMCIELMLNAANLTFVALRDADRRHQRPDVGVLRPRRGGRRGRRRPRHHRVDPAPPAGRDRRRPGGDEGVTGDRCST